MADPIATPIPENGVQSTKVEAVPMEPIRVTVIGTPRNANAPTEQLVATPHGQRDVLVKFVTPIMAIALRFIYAYGTTLIGLVTAGLVTDKIPSRDFADLVIQCSQLSLAGPGVSVLKDLVFVVGKLKERYPLGDV